MAPRTISPAPAAVDSFIPRHIGPIPAEQQEMLATLGYESLEAFIGPLVPQPSSYQHMSLPPKTKGVGRGTGQGTIGGPWCRIEYVVGRLIAAMEEEN